jgi:glutamate synthase (NADPH/NADH)
MPTEYRNLLERKKQEQTSEEKKCEHSSKKIEEPQVEDLEDTVLDEETIQKRRLKLDKLRGFMKYKRKTDSYRDPERRVKDWDEINHRLSRSELHTQAARCMDCGVPYCQTETGCPIGNVIPKWNELVFKDDWREALVRLLMTNNFPEFTGRVW